MYRSSGVPVDSDQNLPEDPTPVEVIDQSFSQDKVPEGTVVVEAPRAGVEANGRVGSIGRSDSFRGGRCI